MTQRSMQSHSRIAFLAMAFLGLMFPHLSCAEGDLHKVKHVIIIMQENHSFDNYFGALALAPGSPYHQPDGSRRPYCRLRERRPQLRRWTHLPSRHQRQLRLLQQQPR